MTVTEICVFTASDEFIANPELAKPGLDFATKADGVISAYQGIQVQDGKTGYLVIDWETHEHHKTVMAQESYREIVESIKPLYTGEFQMDHIAFNKPITEAVSANVTEMATLTLKPGHSKEEFIARVESVGKALETSKGAHPPVTFGWSLDKEDRVVAMLGWDSPQDNLAAFDNEETAKLRTAVNEVAEIHVRHANLAKHH